jgi:catechol 2,3-dioxygenase-like lactoylglutathione lyase family enzyme
MEKIISGIQQIGIGNTDLEKNWAWYRKYFGMDIPVLREAAPAPLMIDYTGDEVQSRDACIALNEKGGGGFEVWQFTSRSAKAANFEPVLGDLGIFICKMKSNDVKATYSFFKNEGLDLLSEVVKSPKGKDHFFMKDPIGNIYEVCKSDDWFGPIKDAKTGGTSGAILGVSSIEKAMKLYADILGFSKVEYDETGVFDDLSALPGGDKKVRRVLLHHEKPLTGPFSEMLGSVYIELVELQDEKGRPIFQDRMWGDQGFIHLCFDVRNMDALKSECAAAGFPFTVDSQESFDMGEAAGRFSYIEDPDGTLIEFVEAHKLPIMKKLGWYLDLNGRDQNKPLPRWMLRAMRFSKRKD